MFVVLSHAVAFASLFVASVFDLDYGEVPDTVLVSGAAVGLFLHAAESLSQGVVDLGALSSFGLLVSDPVVWVSGLGSSLAASLMVGGVCFVYGWAAYLLGVWGGADALALSVLGFAAPTSLSGAFVPHILELGLSLLVCVLAYSLLFAAWKHWCSASARRAFWSSLSRRRYWCMGGAGLGAAFGVAVGGFRGLMSGVLVVLWVPFYLFLSSVQKEAMLEEVPVSELSGGEVVEASGTDSRIRGVSEEEVEELEAEKVTVVQGVRLIPAFPAGLLLAETGFLGFFLII